MSIYIDENNLMKENRNIILYKNKRQRNKLFSKPNIIPDNYIQSTFYFNDNLFRNNQFNKYNIYSNNVQNMINNNNIYQYMNQNYYQNNNSVHQYQPNNYFYQKNFKNNNFKSQKYNNRHYNKYSKNEEQINCEEKLIQERKSSLDTNSTDNENKETFLKEEKEFNNKFNDFNEQKKEANLKNEKNEDIILKNNKNQKEDDFEELYLAPKSRRFSKKSNNSDTSNCTISTLPCSEIDKNEAGVSETFLNHTVNPKTENTVILNVKVKIAKDKYAYFMLKRFDDIFTTITYFCEINNLNEKLIKPLIIKSLCALNTIYQVMNTEIDDNKIELLKKIKNKDNL